LPVGQALARCISSAVCNERATLPAAKSTGSDAQVVSCCLGRLEQLHQPPGIPGGERPHDAQSLLKIESITGVFGGVTLRFTGMAGHSYSVQYRDSLAVGSWQKLADVQTVPTTSTIQINDPVGGGGSARFYRLTTPKLP
jgi:hypothetical protein